MSERKAQSRRGPAVGVGPEPLRSILARLGFSLATRNLVVLYCWRCSAYTIGEAPQVACWACTRFGPSS